MKHFMLDLETLGLSPGCKILSIGCCEIAYVDHPRSFYTEVSRRQERLIEDHEIVKWWESNKNAHTGGILNWDNPEAIHITAALDLLSSWLKRVSDGKEYCVWGNGSDFDNAIIAAAYKVYDKELPWSFRNNRCYRTLKSMSSEFALPFKGNKHNALDDAKNQTTHMIKILMDLRIRLEELN